MNPDSTDISRFVDAQSEVYATALQELRAGRKRTHWMWFIFPQLRGLGFSQTARFYGIAGIDEARAYLAHPVLGERLLESTRAVLSIGDRSLNQIFGSPDDLKFVSSMTLFGEVSEAPGDFADALARFNGGARDAATVKLLSQA